MNHSPGQQLPIHLPHDSPPAVLDLEGVDHQALVAALADLLLEAINQEPRIDEPGENHER